MGEGDGAYQDWVGRAERLEDRVTAWPVQALAATLDQPAPDLCEGAAIPPLWYWLYCRPTPPARTLGPDGHPVRGGFVPPIPLERRMWAGGRFVFHDDIRIGDPIAKTSEVVSVTPKSGRAGPMVFVTVKHSVETPRGLALEEEHDIVYIAMPKAFTPPPPVAAPADPAWTEDIAIDPVLLFRYSALTFNAHRIHYDHQYATEVERYPGLVVHGPLQAMRMIGSAVRWTGRRAARFSFRGVRPLFDFESCRVMGFQRPDGHHDVCIVNGEGLVTMQSTVTWAA